MWPWQGYLPPALIIGPAGPTGATGAAGATGPAGPGPLVSMLAANVTITIDTMAALGLTVPLTGGTRYAFQAVIMLNAGGASDGSKFDFDASTIGVTNFRAWWLDTILPVGAFTTAVATDFVGPQAGDGMVLITGSVEPSSSGNLAMRAAQEGHIAETLTIFRGSWLAAWPLT